MTCRCKEYEACGFARCCDVTVTHDGPPVVTPARGMGIGGMEGVIAREGHAFRAGIREGERRMLRLVFIGAACAEVLYGHIAERATPATVVASCVLLYVAKTQAEAALSALAASGDEDASRVLGERGW